MSDEIRCSICGCGKENTRLWTITYLGTFCSSCESDLNYALTREIMDASTIAHILADTFFRRGKGENVTFEDLWNKHHPDGLTFRRIVEKEVVKK
jgi:hypothetical protein